MSLRWTEDEYQTFLARNRRAAVPAADVERHPVDGPAAADAGEKNHPRYRIAVHSRRRRLADPDGISAKAAIDGLVAGGLIPDDSAEWIESVSYTQEKAEVEETKIDVILVEEWIE